MIYLESVRLNKKQKGFSLLEVVFVIAIMAVAILSLFNLLQLSLRMLWENKARAGAIQLANQKIEIVRNLPYGDVGTIGGVVAGTIPETETVTRNRINYTVYTNVVYVDDEFDGTWESDPVDTLTNDYKRVLVRVDWDSEFKSSQVEFYTDVAPRGVESDLGGGTLALLVFDAGGVPIENAEVRLYNDTLSPLVDFNSFTNAQGQLILAGVKAADDYEIVVTKPAYSTGGTYDTTIDLPTPDPAHVTVNEGRTTSISFQIDELGSMNMLVTDVNGLALSGVELNIHGDKIIGWDGEGFEVYKFDEDKTSNVLGVVSLSDMEWGNYEISIDGSSEGYNISEITPNLPIELSPAGFVTVDVMLEPSAEHSLMVVVKDIEDNPLEGASVLVENIFGFSDVIVTDASGQAFFTPLVNATTTVAVSKSGYEDYLNEFILYGYTTEPAIMSIE